MKSKLSDYELGWLVGLLEGEGHFDFNTYSQKVQVRMTNEDVVNTYANLIKRLTDGVVEVNERYNGPRRQPIFEATVSGERARIVMRTVVTFLHYRRRKKVWQSLNRYRPKIEKITAAEIIELVRKVS